MATECSEQAVLEFLTERGGLVRHMDLIDHFESVWKSDGSKKTLFSERLNRHVDSVAFIKLEDGVKCVCLKENSTSSVKHTDPGNDGESNGNGVCGRDRPLSESGERDGSSNVSRDGNGHSSDKCDPPEKHSNAPEALSWLDNGMESNGDLHHPCCLEEGKVSDVTSGGVTEVKLREVSDDTFSGGEVKLREVSDDTFSGGEVKLREVSDDTFSGGEVKLRDRRRRESAPALGTDSIVLAGQVQVRGSRRTSRGSQKALLTSALSEDGGWEGLDGDWNTPKSSRRNFIELMMSSSPQVRRSLINRGSRLRDSVRSDGDSTSLLSSADGDCVSVALDPLEHEWMLCASDGQWDSLYPLLILDPSLLTKRDFVTGFSCLHWAAKQGNEELLTQLLEHAKQNNVPVDVNVRSSAGYTPLHLAAMHGHTQVVHVLVDQWSVDPEARDYSGRRAGQYLPPGAPSTAALEPGGGTSPVGGGESDTENADSGAQGRWRLPRVLQSNLNPLRLLNGSGEGGEVRGGGAGRSKAVQRKSSLSRINARLHRGRHKTQIIHSTSFRGTGEGVEEGGRGETSPTSPLKGRPISNLFG
uniref:ankyrin repeat domain-containing protein SOWAHC-like isoform X2 n=1 Tax=Oncorhynchus gorbuscha TaxID=8017 RepID=UPI001EAF350E|nr:ankyrin repeat domain-containing protein SOWAHC-like isoform X2 [Oncorhynchus gorbuscha]